MISRNNILGIASIVGYFSLLVGVLGQTAFMSPIIKPHLPSIIAALIFLFPWLIVSTITFTKQSFLAPRPFRFCLLFAMIWFATITITAEVLHYFGYMPPDSPQYAATISRVLMHIGWLGLFYIVPAYIAARQNERKQK